VLPSSAAIVSVTPSSVPQGGPSLARTRTGFREPPRPRSIPTRTPRSASTRSPSPIQPTRLSTSAFLRVRPLARTASTWRLVARSSRPR
jgi:hypothetical protein